MDIIGRIDHTIEDWERRPDAARWTPDGGKPRSKGIGVGAPVDAGQVFCAPLGTPTEDFSAWTPLGTVDPGPTISTELSVPQLEPITHDENGEPFTITIPEAPPAPIWLHMVNCPDCDNNVGESRFLMFPTQEKRREWIGTHCQATGHDIGRMVSVRHDAITFER